MKKNKICFVCKNEITDSNYQLNLTVNMPVCNNCKDSEQEKEEVEKLLDSLADGLICGCI